MTGRSQPRFRSAPTERQASVGCERYLHHIADACPPPGRPTSSAPCLSVPLHRRIPGPGVTPPIVRKRPPRGRFRIVRESALIATETVFSPAVREFAFCPRVWGAVPIEIHRRQQHADLGDEAALGAAAAPVAADHPIRHRWPDISSRGHSGALCREYHGDSPQNSEFVRLRAPHGRRPRQDQRRSGCFPADRRVRPPSQLPGCSVRATTRHAPLRRPPAAPAQAGHRQHPRRTPSHRRVRHGRMCPSGHDERQRRRRRRVIRQDRSAAEEAHQRVDMVPTVALPACSWWYKIERFARRASKRSVVP